MFQSGSDVPMKDPTKHFSVDEMREIIRHIPLKHRLLVYTLARSGRRVSEITRCLTPKDIDFEKNLIHYTILKRKRPTKLLLPADEKLVENLRIYIKNNKIEDDDYIFKISRQRVHQLLQEAAEKTGIERVHAHMFRHTFAIRSAQALKSPADLVQLKDLLGHARIDTTMFYLRFNPTTQRDLLKTLWK